MKLAVIIFLCLLVATLIGAALLWTPDKPRAVLDPKYLAAPADIVEVLDTRLHVRDSGPKTAPAIIMLHGFGSSLHTWEPWAQALAADFRVVRFDLPGSGLSEPDTTGDYSDTRTMNLIAALMDRLGIAQASLIGNSIGGRIAWRFAAREPQRVAKLVLISPDGYASAGFAYGKKPSVSSTLQLMRYFLPKAMLRSSLAGAYGNPDAMTDATVDRYYDLMLAPGSREALIARLEQTVLVDPVPLLGTIKLPVLLLWGEKDAAIPFGHARDYLAALPNAKLVSFPNLGHVPHEEAPAESLPPVRQFLAP